MARIRTIKPEFWTSEQVMECSPLARLMFIGMWNFCDDAGRMTHSAKTIKAQVFPGDNLSVDDVSRLIDELSSIGLIVIYATGGKNYIQVTGWHHQKIDRPKESKIPAPFVDESTNDRDESSNERRGLATDLILLEGIVSDARSTKRRDDEPWLRLAEGIMRAFEAANNPNLPDTRLAEKWIAQGYDPDICLAVVRESLSRSRGRVISSLAYFEKQIHEAHQKRAPAPLKANPINWDHWLKLYRDTGANWPDSIGPSPDLAGCRAPPDVLARHGYARGNAA